MLVCVDASVGVCFDVSVGVLMGSGQNYEI